MFELFQSICRIDFNRPETWEGRIFLTFDIDWATDEVLSDTIDLVEAAQVCATWFVTHDTPVLARLRDNPLFELGIHPNFNPLLDGDTTQGRSAEEILDRLMAIVPEARAVRSHSMTQSSRLQNLFKDRGLEFECNHFIPEQSGICLKPWSLWNGMIKVPYCWEDDVAALYGRLEAFGELETRTDLRVMDFHPIHVFLNMADMVHYDQTRDLHLQPEALRKYRNTEKIGARDVLKAVLGWRQLCA
jgi:hypothetical protein